MRPVDAVMVEVGKLRARVPDLLDVNGWVVTMDPERRQFRRGYVAVSGDSIASVGSMEDRRDDRAGHTIDAAGCAVLPGFINAHTHAVHNLLRGDLADDRPLYDWLLNVVHSGLKAMTANVGPGGPEQLFRCTAVTMRRDAIHQAGLTGIPVTENHVLKLLRCRRTSPRPCTASTPKSRGFTMRPRGGAEFLAIVGPRQRYVNQAKNVILSALGSVAHPKMVIVVDDDIDLQPTEVWWSVLTRAQPTDDVIVIPIAAAGQLDPSAPSNFGSSLMGIDATRPFGEPFPEVVRIPGVENVPDWSDWVRRPRLVGERDGDRDGDRRSGRVERCTTQAGGTQPMSGRRVSAG